MPELRSITAQFPRVGDRGDGRAQFKWGGETWAEHDDAMMLDIETERDAVMLHARMWCVRNGVPTWRDLLKDPVKLAAFHNQNEPMKVGG